MTMKLGTIMDLHQTFYLTKDLSVAPKGSKGVAQKPLKKNPKVGFFGPYVRILNNNICDTLHSTASLVKIL